MRFSVVCTAVLAASIALACFAAFASGEETAMAMKSLGAKTLAQPCPVWVIGSYDAAGKPNAMTASWAAICNSQPPMITVSLRKATYTYGNILASKAFTVNVATEPLASAAAYFGSVSGRDVDKFAETGLTPVRSDLVNAPYIKEFPLVIECRLVKTDSLGLHTMFIGEIVDVKAAPSIVGPNGMPDIAKLRPLVWGPGSEDFYGIGAKVGAETKKDKPAK